MADPATTVLSSPVIVSDNVMTAMVGFVFVCIAFPKMVKHRPQFYIAFVIIVFTMLLGTMAWMFGGDSFGKFVLVLRGFAEMTAFILLVLSTGGLSLKELAGEVGNAIEIMRRGETEKTVIVPLTGEQPKPRGSARGAAVDEGPARPPFVRTPPPREKPRGQIPLDE